MSNKRSSIAVVSVLLVAVLVALVVFAYNYKNSTGQASISGVVSWLFGNSSGQPTGASSNQLALSTPTLTPPAYSCVTLGDINCDSKVDSGDALLIMQYVKGMRTLNSYQVSRADINKDGYVSMNDALVIQSKETGYPVKIPYVFRVGDVNKDDVVDIGDALIIQQTIKGLRSSNYDYDIRGDVNNDGRVDNDDSKVIMSLAVGLWGDVNGSGAIDGNDPILMSYDFYKIGQLLSPVQIKLADYNRDGKFNYTDINLVLRKAGGR